MLATYQMGAPLQYAVPAIGKKDEAKALASYSIAIELSEPEATHWTYIIDTVSREVR